VLLVALSSRPSSPHPCAPHPCERIRRKAGEAPAEYTQMHHPFSRPHIHTNRPVLGGCRGELGKDAVDGKVSLSSLVESCHCSLTNLWLRWRMILLSPEEEDDIATQLAGSGWYRAVGEITSNHSWHAVTDVLARANNMSVRASLSRCKLSRMSSITSRCRRLTSPRYVSLDNWLLLN